MEITLTVAGGADGLRALTRELDELRGAVRRPPEAPRPGELGALDEALVVAVGQGGALTVLVTVLIAWLRRRAGEVVIKLTKADGTAVEVKATQVRAMAAKDLKALASAGQTDESAPHSASRTSSRSRSSIPGSIACATAAMRTTGSLMPRYLT
jgi:hypothetical protein